MSFAFDPEFAQALQTFAQQFGAMPPKPPVGDVESRRVATSKLGDLLMPAVEDVDETSYQTKAADGHVIDIYAYTKKGVPSSSPGPAVCHFHGGGMIAGDAHLFGQVLKSDVSATGVPHYTV